MEVIAAFRASVLLHLMLSSMLLNVVLRQPVGSW